MIQFFSWSNHFIIISSQSLAIISWCIYMHEVSVAREKCINLLDLGAIIKAYVEKIRIMSFLRIHLWIKSTQRNIRNVFDSPWKSIRLNLMFDWQGNFTSIYYKVCLRKRKSCFSKNGILLTNMLHWTSILVQMENGWWILDECMQVQWCFMH